MLEIYKKFAQMNEGFVNVQKNTDLKLPKEVKSPNKEEINIIKETIDKVVSTGDFNLLYDLRGYIL